MALKLRQQAVVGRSSRQEVCAQPRAIALRSAKAPLRSVAPATVTAVTAVRPRVATDGRGTRPSVKTCAAAQAATDSQQKPGSAYKDAIVFQTFAWDSCMKGGWYKNLESKVPAIKAAGVTHAWLPPPSQSVSAQGYMPGQLYNLKTMYGDKDALVSLNKALKAEGIKPVADIVINHRCADETMDGVYNKFRDDVDHQGRKIDWGRWAITGNDPKFGGTGNPDTGDDYGPAPDLDHLNPDLRQALKDWMNWLKDDIGFDGWRFDFARGYGARFITEYVEATVGLDAFNVGEYWVDCKWNGCDLDFNQDEARQKIVDWCNANGKASTAFDFPTKGILQEAVKHTQYNRLKDGRGKAPGVIGWWPAMACTFVDNHDTGSTQKHWPFPSERVGLGYAYILTHPGIPCIFYDHLFTWGDQLAKEINALAAMRRRQGIVSDSKLDIRCAEPDMYVAVIDNKICVKLGPRFDMGPHLPKESDGWKFSCSGKDYAVWEKK